MNWSSFGFKTVAQGKLYNAALQMAINWALDLNMGRDYITWEEFKELNWEVSEVSA